MKPHAIAWTGILLLLISGCRSTELIERNPENLSPSDIPAAEILEMIPDYRQSLMTVSGSGRVSLSQPGNSESASIDFHSDRRRSLLTVRNRIGIEGAHILVDEDSVLVYNRVDEIAERTSVSNPDLTQLGSLATLNLIGLLNFTLSSEDIFRIFENENVYVVVSSDGLRVTIDKTSGFIVRVDASGQSGAPYGEIIYQQYGQLGEFTLPRRITIFSSDGQSRVVLLVRELEANPELPPMELSIPEDIPIQIL